MPTQHRPAFSKRRISRVLGAATAAAGVVTVFVTPAATATEQYTTTASAVSNCEGIVAVDFVSDYPTGEPAQAFVSYNGKTSYGDLNYPGSVQVAVSPAQTSVFAYTDDGSLGGVTLEWEEPAYCEPTSTEPTEPTDVTETTEPTETSEETTSSSQTSETSNTSSESSTSQTSEETTSSEVTEPTCRYGDHFDDKLGCVPNEPDDPGTSPTFSSETTASSAIPAPLQATPVFNYIAPTCDDPNFTASVTGEGVVPATVTVEPGQVGELPVVGQAGYVVTADGRASAVQLVTNNFDSSVCAAPAAQPAPPKDDCVVAVPPDSGWTINHDTVTVVEDQQGSQDSWQLDGDVSTYGAGSGDTGDGPLVSTGVSLSMYEGFGVAAIVAGFGLLLASWLPRRQPGAHRA